MRRFLVLSMTLALTVTAAACGGGKAAPTTAISHAAEKTADGGSAKLEVKVVSTNTSAGPTTTIKGTATTNPASTAPTKVTGVVDFKETKGRFDISSPSFGNTPAQAVLVGQVFYFKGLAGFALPGKPWIKIDLDKAGSGGVAGQLQSLNPNSYLVQLKGVTGDVKEVGKEKVRGENTTHYSFTIDLDKAARLAPAAQKASIEAAAKTVVNKSLAAEAWLDGKGRARRVEQTVVIASGATSSTTHLTLEYFDFGTKVDATIPPADQTSDFTSILSGLGRG